MQVVTARTTKRITRKLRIEEQRSASLRRRASSWRSQKDADGSGGKRGGDQATAGFGQVTLEHVGQGQVSPVGGEFHFLRGGNSFVDAGNRLVQPAGAARGRPECSKNSV